MAKEKWMIVIYGPNGAGKSTFYENFLKTDPFFKEVDFINLDVEAAKLSGGNQSPEDVMLEAGRNIKSRLDERMEKHESFIYETTSAGRSHFKIMKKASALGFKIASVFIGLSSAKLSLLRVKERVNNGGHDVSPEVIERRFPHVMKNFPEMLRLSDIAVAYNNSGKNPYQLIFMMDRRKLFVFHSYPKWLDSALKGRKTRKKIVHITKEKVSEMDAKKIENITETVLGLLNQKAK